MKRIKITAMIIPAMAPPLSPVFAFAFGSVLSVGFGGPFVGDPKNYQTKTH